MGTLENLGINWKVLIGQAINFLILLFLMKKFVFPRFFILLKERREKIEEGIRKLEEAKKKSEMVEIEREKILREAKEKIDLMMKEAEKRAKLKEAKIIEMAEKEKEKIIEEAKRMGQNEIEKLKEDFLKESLKISFLLAEKILGKKIDEKEDKKLIMEFLNQINGYEK
jgi:F-type H+-transporting ATPase subunit b